MHIQAEAKVDVEPANAKTRASEVKAGPKANVETVRLVEGLPADELVRQIHYFRRKGEVGHRGLGFYLLDLDRRGLYRPKAASAAKWAAKELDMHVKFARRLIRTARKLEALERTDRLFASGKLPWTKVEILASVATERTEGEWIDYALKHSYAELRAAAARARKNKDGVPGDGLEVGRTMYTVQHRVSAVAHQVYERALARARDSLGPGATPAEAFRRLCEMALGAAGPKEGAAPGAESPSTPPRCTPSPYTVVVHVDPKGIYVLKEGPDGRLIREPVAPEELARILGLGARVAVAPPIAVEGEVKTIRFGERGSVPKDERAPPVSAEERERILLREGSRCAVCGSEHDLTIAHLVARAHGGQNEIRILVVLCKRCHSAEHEGLIRLLIERGHLKALGRDGKPLDASVSDAEALGSSAERGGWSETPLLVLDVPEKKNPSAGGNDPSEPVPSSDPKEAPFSVKDLPAEIDAATWRKLQDDLQWSPSRKAYLLRPGCERPCLEDQKSGEAARAADPPAEVAAAPAATGELPLAAQTQPRSLKDFVGQERAVENIRVLVRAARARGEVPGHILLSGPAGLGKSTLAVLVARECGGRLVRSVGAEIEPNALASLLGDLRRGDVLFLDEIHGLSRGAEEALYSALVEGFVDVLVADSAAARTRAIRVRLEPFTLLGATTMAGALSESFRNRFALYEPLRAYSEEDLAEIVSRAAERLGTKLAIGAAQAVAERARGIPREALRLFARARDLATIWGRNEVFASDVEVAAERLGLGPDRLFAEERMILDLLLKRGGALGIDAMAEVLAMDRATLEAVYEPWLVRRGLLERTERGRVATEAAVVLRARFPELGGNGDGSANGNGNGRKPMPDTG